jgi:DNA (cytosine-5)-methyltransferase 1
MLLGHEPVCAVEIDAYCRQVLQARQDDGWLPEFPIYEDVRQFDGRPWRGKVDVVAGGFPCQPWSQAGKRKGTGDPRHLWPEMARIIQEVRPRYVFAENVSIRAFEEPWRDLRGLGYRIPPAICVAAEDVGAPHLRKRWWLLAALDGDAHDAGQSTIPQHDEARRVPTLGEPSESGWWDYEPDICRVVDGLAHRMDRLRALGNGQVPMAAATAWGLLMYLLRSA